jgi:general secretion pathway protein G
LRKKGGTIVKRRSPSTDSCRRALTGFTLIEVLIVVVILGLLAAVVMTNASAAGHESRIGSMVSQLREINTILEVYRAEHRGLNPPLVGSGQWDAMLTKTNSAGTTPAAGEQSYGPYMDRTPVNPLTGSSTVVAVGTAAAVTTGWYFDQTTGRLHGANKVGAMSNDGK